MLFYSFLLGIVILIMVGLRTCSIPIEKAHRLGDNTRGTDTLNVAMEFSPMGVYSSGDTLSGFYYDLLQLLSQHHGFHIHVSGFNHGADVLPALESGALDIVVADMPLTGALKERFAFTKPVITDRQVLVQLRDTITNAISYPSQLSLIGHTLYLPAHSPFKSRIENLARELGGEILLEEHPEYGAEQLVISVALGQIPNAVVNSRVASILLRDYPQLDASVELSLNQFQSWLVNPADSVLRDSLNIWLDNIKTTKEYDQLLKRYFN